MKLFFNRFIFYIFFIYSAQLYADTYVAHTSDLNITSSPYIGNGVVKKNDHDQYTITLTQAGNLEISLSGANLATVKFAFSTVSMPDTASTDATLSTLGPQAYNAGQIIYVSVHAPSQTSDKSYGITFTLSADNTAPTDISLSNATVNENAVIGTTIGTFSTLDVDIGNSFTYSLVGGVDDANFSISGSNLITNATFNFATKALYSILIRTDDGQGGTYDKDFNITIAQGIQPVITASQTFSVDESASNGDILGTITTINSPSSFSITNDDSNGTFSIDNFGVLTVANNSNLDYNTTTSYILGILASNIDGSDEKNITINVTHIIAPDESNIYGCDMFGSVIVTYDYLDVSGTANAQACGTENISYPSGQISGSIDCLSDIACGGTGAECERIDPPANQLNYSWTHPDNPILDESPANPTPLTDMSYGNIAYNGGSATFNATAINPNNNNKYMYIGNATFDQTLISFTSGDYYFESFSITKNKNDVNNFFIDATNGPVRIFIKNNLFLDMNNLYLNHSGSPSDLFIYVGGNFTNPGSGGGNTHMNAYFYVEGNVLLNNSSNNWIIEGGITAEGTITIAGNNPDFIQADEAGNLGYGACSICFQDVQAISSSPSIVSNSFVNLKGSTIYDLNIYKTYTGTNSASGCTTTDGTCTAASVSIDFDNLENFTYGNNYGGYKYDLNNYAIFQFSTITDTNTHIFDLTEYDTSARVNNNIDIDALFIADYYDMASGGKFYHTIVEQCSLGSAGNNFDPGILDAVDTNCTAGFADTLLGCAGKNISTKVAGKAYDLNILDSNSSSNMLFGTALAYSVDGVMNYKYIGEINATDENGITTFTLENSDSANNWNDISNILATKEAWIQFYYCNSSQNWRECYVVGGENVYITKSYDANESSSHDKFSIRPKSYNVELNATDITKLQAGKSYTIDINATFDSNNSSVRGYIQTLSALSNKLASKILNPIASCTLSDSESFSAAFNDGNYSADNFTYTDVGDINISLYDSSWTAIDQSNNGCILGSSSALSTPVGCNIEAVKQVKFIPEHFKVDATLSNRGNGFTYLSSDLNMASTLDITITAQSENNNTTQNYNSACYAQATDYNISYNSITTDPAGTLSKILYKETNTSIEGNQVLNENITLSSVPASIFSTATNGIANISLSINFDRNLTKTVNPFIFKIQDINISDVDNVAGAKTFSDQNATFIYGRTHALRYRFIGNIGTAFLYYESFCNGAGCDKNLLPNSSTSKTTDDPRWFINTNHTVVSGTASTINQKGTSTHITATDATGSHQDNSVLTYDAVKGYPYKATMENNASSWLIYNKYNAAATKNEFEVEFTKATGDWAGVRETNTTTLGGGTDRTNRRTMW